MTYQLDRLVIHQFRAIQALTLEGLGRINLLVGPNDSGKTSVLEAIAVFCQPLDLLRWIELAQKRDVQGQLDQVHALRWLFPKQNATQHSQMLRLAGAGRYIGRECSVQFTEIERSEQPRVNADDAMLKGALFGAVSGAVLGRKEDQATNAALGALMAAALARANALNTAPIPSRRGIQLSVTCKLKAGEQRDLKSEVWQGTPFVQAISSTIGLPIRLLSPFSHRLEGLQLDQLSDATRINQLAEVTKVLQLVSPKILGLEILTDQGAPQLHVQHSDLGLAPISVFGDGVRRALTYALALSMVRGGVLLIDELETAIHTSALGPVFAWLVKACDHFDVQLFATTHSLEAVDAILAACRPDHLDQIVGFRIEAGRVKRFRGDLLEGMRYDMGLDIRGGR